MKRDMIITIRMGIIGLILFISILFLFPSVLASDLLVWQGQYFTGTTFNVGTYNFNFTVYDAQVGGGRAIPTQLL